MKLPSIQQAIFSLSGAATTIASAMGTYSYLLHETGNDITLAGSAAAAMGCAIYAGWDVFFNHTGWRKLPALTIAVVLSAISTWTIYESTSQHKQQTDYQQRQQEQNSENEKQAAIREVLEQQQTDTRVALSDLKAMQATDQARLTDRQEQIEKGIKPTANHAAITATAAAMDKRSQRIAQLQDQLSELTNKILTVTQQGKPANAPQGTGSQSAADAVDYPRLARAALYDTLTFLFLLLGSWYRNQRTTEESAEVIGLQQAISQLNTAADIADSKRQGALQVAEQLEQRIQKAIITCNEALAGVTEALTPVTESLTGVTDAATAEQDQLSENAAIILLENRQIKANGNDNLTTSIIQQATGWGRNRAKKLLENAHKKGILTRATHGNAWVYSYATGQEQQLELPGNVFQLSNARTA